jgi:Inward rectifier potassium channel C-terminal domain
LRRVQEVDLGYEQGSDRLVLRFPQLVTHALAPESPLARWAQARGAPSHAAELVVIVEGVSFASSASLARTATFRLPQDLRRDHYFAPMVSTGPGEAAAPAVDWAAFHETMPLGQKWLPAQSSEGSVDLRAGLGGRPAWQESLQGGDSRSALAPSEVELTDAGGE